MVSLPIVKTPGVIRPVGEVAVEVVELLDVEGVDEPPLPHAASSNDNIIMIPDVSIIIEA